MSDALDFRKAFPGYYDAEEEPHLVRFGALPYLTVQGQGEPGGEAFQAGIHALYAVAYALKFQARAGGLDFKVPALEAQWWAPGKRPLDKVPRESWHWRLMVRVPPAVGAKALDAARQSAAAKGVEGAPAVLLERIDEGDCLQTLHVGPYGKEGRAIHRIEKRAEEIGLHLAGRHHEIYLNDPGRVAPSKAKTIVRWPVG